jgi:hypothetical protein
VISFLGQSLHIWVKQSHFQEPTKKVVAFELVQHSKPIFIRLLTSIPLSIFIVIQTRIMAYHDEYGQWPFLNEEEFELACAFFDRRYVKSNLGPKRAIFKVRHRRLATTSGSYIEILRLLQIPEEADELSSMLERLGGSHGHVTVEEDMHIDAKEEDDDQVCPSPS